ncbi:hypothetical protein E1B28_000791 [Marasmius oreades]|uniref:HAT C-terminal dimerisation domain-containing protein n=1 Tax=Marasmius oreades TaxID=181124 RepID=A0A9P8AEH9_9AGAR|nr:uncharacterized protein E1B28_000791 [Marasmius oreades]KAG7098891.1 hypothetical protein E1B28_000791 [Marasmius oreades]
MICVWPDTRQSQNGLSAVSSEVVTIILMDNACWTYLAQTIKVVKPVVDMIGDCESRQATLADCMLQLLSTTRTLSEMRCEGNKDPAFLNHARAVFDKRFHKIATPIHKLTLFLHPLCHQLAICDRVGFTLADIKKTALGLAKKWKWSLDKAMQLSNDLECYYQCKDPFAGGTGNAREWWKSLPIQAIKYPLKSLAIIIHSIVPHSAEGERLFSRLGGVQTPKQNSLSVLVFEKLAVVRNHLSNQLTIREKVPAKSTHCKHAHMHTAEGPTITSAVVEDLEDSMTWKPPLDSSDTTPDPTQGSTDETPVDTAFKDLEKELEDEQSVFGGDLYEDGPSITSGDVFNLMKLERLLRVLHQQLMLRRLRL